MYIKQNDHEKVYENIISNVHTYEALREILQSQYASECVETLQQERLNQVVQTAYEKTKFYKESFDRSGFEGNCRSREELAKLPILQKKDIKTNFFDMIVQGYPLNQCMRNRTSGSTGEPVVNLQDFKVHNEIFNINFIRQRLAWGIGGMNHMLMIVPKHYAIKDADYPEYVINDVTFDKVWQIHPTEVEYDYEEIFHTIQPEIIYGNPYLLKYLANKIDQEKISIVFPKVIISSFEMLDDSSREYLEHVFHCRILNVYGFSEVGDVAWQCPENQGLHINDENIILEVVNEKNEPVYGEIGDIVVTSLYNHPMPIIRYKTGDKGILDHSEYKCGRKLWKLKSVYGRSVDFIRLPTGQLIAPYEIMRVMNLLNMGQFQIIQEDEHMITVKCISSLEDSTLQIIKSKMEQITHSMMDIRFECVDTIPLDASGKFRAIMSKLGEGRLSDGINNSTYI